MRRHVPQTQRARAHSRSPAIVSGSGEPFPIASSTLLLSPPPREPFVNPIGVLRCVRPERPQDAGEPPPPPENLPGVRRRAHTRTSLLHQTPPTLPARAFSSRGGDEPEQKAPRRPRGKRPRAEQKTRLPGRTSRTRTQNAHVVVKNQL